MKQELVDFISGTCDTKCGDACCGVYCYVICDFAKRFSIALAIWRREQKLTQLALANMVGLSRNTISLIENNAADTMNLETLIRLCGIMNLRLTLERIGGGNVDMSPNDAAVWVERERQYKGGDVKVSWQKQVDSWLHDILMIAEMSNDLKDKLNRGFGARELAVAVTKLEEAAMWIKLAQERNDELGGRCDCGEEDAPEEHLNPNYRTG